ncbi:hypothetical protein FOMG_00567 [Fusarium oxysporum f. sp. melonis 26406]|uniref:Uncharacterized protein n=1 Tax=Fusarium oxysporum f. sp. melonis 26406 TaxID=1089452 RepID=X0ATE7_FUSOX|nr:hypothetical protein FOMG_00567 [Fusarium oxysporum f. sp. melonis 26406]
MATIDDDGDVAMPDATPPPHDDNDTTGNDLYDAKTRGYSYTDMNIFDDDGDCIAIDRKTCPPDLEFEDALSFCFEAVPEAVSNKHVLSLHRGKNMTEEMLHQVAKRLTNDTPVDVIPDWLIHAFARGQQEHRILRKLASYFVYSDPNSAKVVFITDVLDHEAAVIASCTVRQTICIVSIQGARSTSLQFEWLLRQVFAAVTPIIRQRSPRFFFKIPRDVIPILERSLDLGLVLARIVMDEVDDRPFSER